MCESFLFFSEHVFRSNPFGRRRLAAVVDRLLVDDRGSPDLGVRAQPRIQPLDGHVSRAGELGGRRARGGVRDHVSGHRPVGRASQLHARGHVVVAGRRTAPNGQGHGLRTRDENLPVERVHGGTGHQPGAARVRTHFRHAGNAGHTERRRARVRRRHHGVAAFGVHVRAAGQAGLAGRLRGPVLDRQLDAGGHGRPRPPVVPGHSARRPADTRDVRPPAGQRTGVRAHHTSSVVQRRGPRPPVAGAPAHHVVRQHSPLGRTGPADWTQRPRDRWHTPEPAARTASQSKCLIARPSLSRSRTALYWFIPM